MSDLKSICPRIEMGYAYTPDKNDELVKKFKKKFSKGSAILRIKFYCPKNLIDRHIPVK